jgi:RHS repeat-associated protein
LGADTEEQPTMPVRKYIYDGDAVLQETDGAGVALTEYTRTGGGYGDLLSAYDGTSARYYEPDALGSTDALADQSQAVVDRWSYRAFGQATQTAGTDSTPFTWVGRLGYFADTETSLYLLGSGTRYYDPVVAQFLSEDPMGFPFEDQNRRKYVQNRPTVALDATGLFCEIQLRQSKEVPVAQKATCDGPFMLALQFAFDRFMSCKASAAKFSECQSACLHDITIACDDKMNVDARWDPNSYRVKINPNAIKHKDRSIGYMVGMILFEVLNACNTPLTEKHSTDCQHGDLSMTDYVKAIEFDEYSNFLEHHRIVAACSAGANAPWQQKADFFAAYASVSFDDYLKQAIAGGHTKNYEEYWKTNCATAYDTLHPKKEK